MERHRLAEPHRLAAPVGARPWQRPRRAADRRSHTTLLRWGGAVASVVLTGVAVAPIASAADTDQYDSGVAANGSRLWGTATFGGPRVVDAIISATDSPRDNLCTYVQLEVHDSGNHKIGDSQPLGTVCGGRTATFPSKRISTVSADIYFLVIQGFVGPNGPVSAGTGLCRNGSDGAENRW